MTGELQPAVSGDSVQRACVFMWEDTQHNQVFGLSPVVVGVSQKAFALFLSSSCTFEEDQNVIVLPLGDSDGGRQAGRKQ